MTLEQKIFRKQQRLEEACRNELDESMSCPHSGAYHRFFEGYAETELLAGDGRRRRILRTYVGDLYTLKGGRTCWLARKAEYLVLYLLTAVLFGVGLTRPDGCRAMPVELMQAAGILALLWLLVKVLGYLTAPRQMTVYFYRTASRGLLWWSRLAAAVLALNALAAAAGALWYHSGMAAPAAYLLASAAAAWLTWREAKADYRVDSGKHESRDGGVVLE